MTSHEDVIILYIHVPLGSLSNDFLVGGFNPFEKYVSNWMISPGRGENKKYLKPPPSFLLSINGLAGAKAFFVVHKLLVPTFFTLHHSLSHVINSPIHTPIHIHTVELIET